MRPQKFDLHPTDDVVEAVQVGVTQYVLDRAAALTLRADRVAGVAYGQVQQPARYQDGVFHLAYRAHERLHAVQDAGVAELWLVVPGDPPQARPAKEKLPVILMDATPRDFGGCVQHVP